MAPGNRGEAAQNQHRQGLEHHQGEGELHASREPHSMPATRATKPATAQTIAQMCLSGMPTDSAA